MWREFKNKLNKIEFVNLGEGNLLKISQGKNENEWYCVPSQNTSKNQFKIVCSVDELRQKLASNPTKLLG